jgi:hypothetical protein
MLHFNPPTPHESGGARKASVANIKEIDITEIQMEQVYSQMA